MAELADARDLKSLGRKLVRVQVPPRPPAIRDMERFLDVGQFAVY